MTPEGLLVIAELAAWGVTYYVGDDERLKVRVPEELSRHLVREIIHDNLAVLYLDAETCAACPRHREDA